MKRIRSLTIRNTLEVPPHIAAPLIKIGFRVSKGELGDPNWMYLRTSSPLESIWLYRINRNTYHLGVTGDFGFSVKEREVLNAVSVISAWVRVGAYPYKLTIEGEYYE